MKIVDEKLLQQYRTPGNCEVCGKWCKSREAHHIFGRGMGSGFRLDTVENLLAVGTAFECSCHRDFHDGRTKREKLLEIVAAKLGRTADDIEAEIRLLQRTPRGWAHR